MFHEEMIETEYCKLQMIETKYGKLEPVTEFQLTLYRATNF